VSNTALLADRGNLTGTPNAAPLLVIIGATDETAAAVSRRAQLSWSWLASAV